MEQSCSKTLEIHEDHLPQPKTMRPRFAYRFIINKSCSLSSKPYSWLLCDSKCRYKSPSKPNQKILEPEPGLVLTLHFVQVHFTTDKIRPGSAKIFFLEPEVEPVNLSDFYSYRLLGKLTGFLQLQEFSQRNQTWELRTSTFAARLCLRCSNLGLEISSLSPQLYV
jgi:hypothetical protein